MINVAFVAGIFIGWFVFRKNIAGLLTVILLTPYRTENRFLGLYDLADDEATYKTSPVPSVRKYADYLKIHQEAKNSVYPHFRSIYSSYSKVLLLSLVVALIPAVIFWASWYVYAIGVALAIAVMALHHFFIIGRGAGYYQRAVIHTTISLHLKKTKDDQ